MTSARIAVVIATFGRPVEVGQLVSHLLRQSLAPSTIVLSYTDRSDVPADLPSSVRLVSGSPGSSAQRNRGLALIENECDFIAFLDDDYLPSVRALEGMARLFAAHPDIVGADGQLLADGIHSAGIDYRAACEAIDGFDREAVAPLRLVDDARGLYGCNMVFRAAALENARFDENLPLYGWQEDIDFAAQFLPRGRLVHSNAFAGIHRGVKRGRTSGLRLGYSQVVNPIYLSRKGTMPPAYATKLIVKNAIANHVRALWPEPWVDRFGRARGNWLALWHLMTGRADPRHITRLN